MKRMIGMAAAAVFALAGTALAGEKVTLHGEILDSTCYFAHDKKGWAHGKCAQQCLRKGIPAALLTDDEKLVLLLPLLDDGGIFEKVKAFAAERVEIGGEWIKKGGVAAVVVESVSVKKLDAPSPAKTAPTEGGYMGGHSH